MELTEMTLQDTEYASLTAARNYLGKIQKCQTCTSIQTTVIKVDRNNVLMFTSLGLGAIASAFEEAAMLYTWTNGYLGKKNKRIANIALAFIQGTGLDVAVRFYGFDYDTELLRNTFFRIFHVEAKS